jgi:hypothetical protein
LKDPERGRNLVIEIGVGRIALGAEFDPRDVAHPRHDAVRVGGNDDVVELLRAREPPKRLYGHLERALRFRGGLIDGAGGDLHIGGAQRRHYIACGQAAGLQPRPPSVARSPDIR